MKSKYSMKVSYRPCVCRSNSNLNGRSPNFFHHFNFHPLSETSSCQHPKENTRPLHPQHPPPPRNASTNIPPLPLPLPRPSNRVPNPRLNSSKKPGLKFMSPFPLQQYLLSTHTFNPTLLLHSY